MPATSRHDAAKMRAERVRAAVSGRDAGVDPRRRVCPVGRELDGMRVPAGVVGRPVRRRVGDDRRRLVELDVTVRSTVSVPSVAMQPCWLPARVLRQRDVDAAALSAAAGDEPDEPHRRPEPAGAVLRAVARALHRAAPRAPRRPRRPTRRRRRAARRRAGAPLRHPRFAADAVDHAQAGERQGQERERRGDLRRLGRPVSRLTPRSVTTAVVKPGACDGIGVRRADASRSFLARRRSRLAAARAARRPLAPARGRAASGPRARRLLPGGGGRRCRRRRRGRGRPQRTGRRGRAQRGRSAGGRAPWRGLRRRGCPASGSGVRRGSAAVGAGSGPCPAARAAGIPASARTSAPRRSHLLRLPAKHRSPVRRS